MIIMISSSLIESRICKLLFIAVRDPCYSVTVWECPHIPKYIWEYPPGIRGTSTGEYPSGE